MRFAYGTLPVKFFPKIVNTSCVIVTQEPTVNCSTGKNVVQKSNAWSHNLTDPSKVHVILTLGRNAI